MEQKLDFTNPQYYENRELSWIKFDQRVLEEARDKSIPLLERLKFISITSSNLDEFYMVRVGTLMTQMNLKEKVCENKTGMDSESQVKAILKKTKVMEKKKAKVYEQIMGELEPHGIRIINFDR